MSRSSQSPNSLIRPPRGRLTLNVLLSFAQFEREVIGERIRDKIDASKRKGGWMGGTRPLGYEIRERKLIVNQAEADTVRHIFNRYLELGRAPPLTSELAEGGIFSEIKISKATIIRAVGRSRAAAFTMCEAVINVREHRARTLTAGRS